MKVSLGLATEKALVRWKPSKGSTTLLIRSSIARDGHKGHFGKLSQLRRSKIYGIDHLMSTSFENIDSRITCKTRRQSPEQPDGFCVIRRRRLGKEIDKQRR
jgi:hypothetical protein